MELTPAEFLVVLSYLLWALGRQQQQEEQAKELRTGQASFLIAELPNVVSIALFVLPLLQRRRRHRRIAAWLMTLPLLDPGHTFRPIIRAAAAGLTEALHDFGIPKGLEN